MRDPPEGFSISYCFEIGVVVLHVEKEGKTLKNTEA